MKEVKIYTIISDQLSPPITGESFCTDMVRHSDYAELEARCAALAAENAVLKEAAEFSTAPDMWEELGGNMMRYLYQEWYAEKLKAALQAPATDAFLADVRAQGVERYAAQLKSEAELANETGWDGAAKFLISESEKVLAFAAQLRQEAAQ